MAQHIRFPVACNKQVDRADSCNSAAVHGGSETSCSSRLWGEEMFFCGALPSGLFCYGQERLYSKPKHAPGSNEELQARLNALREQNQVAHVLCGTNTMSCH
eukprot:3459101-Amphidinium_carterae.1